MRIVYLSTGMPVKCGIATYTYYLSQAILKNDENIKVIILSEYGAEKVLTERYICLPCFNRKENFDVQCSKMIENYKPDIVHIQHEYGIWGTNSMFLNLLDKINIPKFVTLHTVLTTYSQAEKVQNLEIYQVEIAKRVDKIILHTNLQREVLIRMGIPENKLIVIPHGTEVIENTDKTLARKKLCLPIDAKIVLAFGFIGSDKNIHLLIKMMRILVKRLKFTNAFLYIVGEAKSKEDKKYAIMCKLQCALYIRKNAKIMVKFVPEEMVNSILISSDVICCFGKSEGYSSSGALHRALGAKKPIIVSRTPRYTELEFLPEIFVLPENTDRVAKIIYKLFTDEEFNNYITKKLTEYAENTSWLNTAKKHIDIYKTFTHI